jgi:hypothetical protein
MFALFSFPRAAISIRRLFFFFDFSKRSMIDITITATMEEYKIHPQQYKSRTRVRAYDVPRYVDQSSNILLLNKMSQARNQKNSVTIINYEARFGAFWFAFLNFTSITHVTKNQTRKNY